MNNVDTGSIFPFREDEPRGRGFFEIPADVPPKPCVSGVVGPDTPGYRRQKSIRAFYQEWFEGENMSLDDLYSSRLRAAWRITRELANLRGVLTGKKQTLADATKLLPSAWITHFHLYANVTQDLFVHDLVTGRALPLLPPDVPCLHEDGHVDEGYDVEKDEVLEDYIRLTEYTATQRLSMPRTLIGRQGMAGLFDPKIARVAWPSAMEIQGFEQELVEKIYGILVRTDEGGGDAEAVAQLRYTYELHPHEIQQVMAMARAWSSQATGLDDPETYFMMEVARMRELAQRQAGHGDFRGSAQTRRDILRLLGTRGTASGEEDFDGIVEQENARVRKKLPPPEKDGMIEG